MNRKNNEVEIYEKKSMLTILLYFLPQECSHICLFKNKDFLKKKNYKYFKLISYRNNKTQWPTCNMLAHCTIWFFFYLNFCIKKGYICGVY